MNILRETFYLLKRDIVLEWRSPYALAAVLLYVLSTVYIVFYALSRMPAPLWNAIFWVIMLFTAVSVVMRSFGQESGNRKLYYYQLANPIAVLLSKTAYNLGLLFILGLLTWLSMAILANNPVREINTFLIAVLLGSSGLSIALTFVSAIAAQANNNATLMAILGFPIIIPILLTLVRFTASTVGLLDGADNSSNILTLIGIDMALLGVGIILFPFLWKE